MANNILLFGWRRAPKDEDGFKVKLLANGSGFRFTDDYRSLVGLTNVQVGVNTFNSAIQGLLKYFRSDDDNLSMWKQEITQICVFVCEVARNKYVFYDGYKRIEGSVSPWSPLRIRSWKSCSKKGYERDHDIVVEKSDAELELIDCLKEFDANIVDKNYGKFEASSLVSARNKYVLYDGYIRIEGSVSPWSPLLIRSWKSCSKKGYERDHDIVAEKSDAEWELIDCLKEFNANIVDKIMEKLRLVLSYFI
uniref:Uncharacterized protein n=1 Tax=Tanacetum cinerariifolium TaxID=118510 RepID=A0A6L2NA58_TANCI|nr:hypothetical protein [Tanacetum cinerariifolium]